MLRPLLCVCLMGMAGAATAMEITPGGDPDLGCILTLSGPVVPGDAARLRAAIQTYHTENAPGPEDMRALAAFLEDGPRRLCLDSPGGSLDEALRMIDVLITPWTEVDNLQMSLGTAVPAGAECLSACAVFFMAGGRFSAEFTQSSDWEGRRADRVLHVSGHLGFHAPALDVPEGDYGATQIGQAYDAAMLGLAGLSGRMRRIGFRTSLLRQMLAVPSDHFFYVRTVGEAAQWGIDVAGAAPLAEVMDRHIWYGCQNAQRAFAVEMPFATDYATFAAPDAPPAPRSLYEWLRAVEIWDGALFVREETPDGLYFVSDEGDVNGQPNCTGNLIAPTDKLLVTLPTTSGTLVEVGNWALVPPHVTLFALSPRDDPPSPLGPGEVLDADLFEMTTECAAVEGGQVTYRGTCALEAERVLNADLSTETTLRVELEDGERYLFPGTPAALGLEQLGNAFCDGTVRAGDGFCFGAIPAEWQGKTHGEISQ